MIIDFSSSSNILRSLLFSSILFAASMAATSISLSSLRLYETIFCFFNLYSADAAWKKPNFIASLTLR